MKLLGAILTHLFHGMITDFFFDKNDRICIIVVKPKIVDPQDLILSIVHWLSLKAHANSKTNKKVGNSRAIWNICCKLAKAQNIIP